ncbi:C25 family cysteine peptidase [Eisenibacter elegans]|uniref:putative type IX secretion system sortase PorU2 n=1 Tax=Eisenibacter elegans TaxID=997 RepID=UPI0003F4C61E|nr:C25 family cysteine peptidase [Eisenibacter elegans]
MKLFWNQNIVDRQYWLNTVLCLGLLWGMGLQAQNFGNEWIQQGQPYYKISTAQTGMHRVGFAELQNAGLASGAPLGQLQLFHRGQEAAIRIEDNNNNGFFDSGDFLIFYGQRNDGTQDRQLYLQPQFQSNPRYNLFSDTTAYFLTTQTAAIGKRIESYAPPAAGAAEAYHLAEGLTIYNSRWHPGQRYQEGTQNEIFLSEFDRGEGFMSNNATASTTFQVPISAALTSVGVDARIEILLVRTSTADANTSIAIGSNPASLTTVAGRYIPNVEGNALVSFNVPVSSINASGTVHVRVTPTLGTVAVAYLLVRYPQTVDMGAAASKTFITRAASTDLSLQIQNPAANTLLFDITDPLNIRQLPITSSSPTLNTVVTNTSVERRILAWSANTYLSPTRVEAVQFSFFDPTAHDYLIVTHPRLRRPVAGVPDAVQAYADYRASAAGGSYRPLVMNIQQLVDQFNYGERSPLAIRNWVRYLYQQGSPRFLLLIGNAISLPDFSFSSSVRTNPAIWAQDLVPTGGFPPSDVVFSTRIDPAHPHTPVVATGRISTNNPQDVLNYLDKVREFETTGGDFWQNNVLHLSGGRTTTEYSLFRAYVDLFKQIAEQGLYAIRVKTISKRTATEVEFIDISQEVNDGVGLITFFGHSSRDFTDIEIGFASNDVLGYRNKGKYPFMLANGCQLASIFYGGNVSLSQDWLFTRDRGAIGFLAHSYIGFTFPLRNYSNFFYINAFLESFNAGQPIGVILQNVARRYSNTTDQLLISNAQQMLYQGDPAVQFRAGNLPDYATQDNWVSAITFDGSPLTAQADSFQLRVVVTNRGTRSTQDLNLRVRRTFPSGTVRTYVSSLPYPPVDSRDTLYFTLRNDPELNSFGLNRFEVRIDPDDTIEEITKNNNTGILELNIPGIGVRALLPPEFSIVNQNMVRLIVTPNQVPDPTRQFTIELDTSPSFNSPNKRSTTLPASTTGIWEVPLSGADSTVYYWRSNFADVVNNPGSIWSESSFTYIPGSAEGWTQRQFAQFRKSIIESLQPNEVAQRYDFQGSQTLISASTFGSTSGGNVSTDLSVLWNNFALTFANRCGGDAILAVAFRQNTLQPYLVFPVSFCGREPSVINRYTNTQIQGGELATYIDAVPAGDYILLVAVGNIQFSSWTAAMRTKLQEIGANPTLVNTLQSGHPYIIFGQKGAALGTAEESLPITFANPTGDRISLHKEIVQSVNEGVLISSPIGPARSWQSLQHRIEAEPTDTYTLSLIGEDLQGTPTVLIPNLNNSPSLDISNINAVTYPFLRFRLEMRDAVNFTPVQVRNWLVLYEGVPEGFLNLDAVGRETYQLAEQPEGSRFTLPFVFENLTPLNFTDSLLVRFSTRNLNNGQITVEEVKLAPLAGNASVSFEITIDTRGRVGNNELTVFVNPRLQPELNYDNNIAVVPFVVRRDNTHPLLEVAFDGRTILDGEIVSPQPLISVRIRDENAFLAFQDTTHLQVSLRRNCPDCSFERIYFGDPAARWSITEGNNPQLNFEYKPSTPLEDGVYTLKAQGTDVSGNLSGSNDYLINFEVVNESTITHFYPYPNPFSTSTRFVFTLTGQEVPQRLKIQIMTISGKVVREITQDEIGPIRIGNNLTEYAWDGRDEFGDILANGVYLYRVLIEGGENYSQRATAGDRAFKRGFGKLYILR